MSQGQRLSRRSALQLMAATGAAGTFASTWPIGEASAQRNLVCGAIEVGLKDDFGWNQGHAQGVAAIKKLANIRVVEEENVPETIEVQKSMESMINLDKAELIFATSYGYWEHMLKIAAKYPKVQFVHAGPTVWKEGMPQNAGSYNGFIDEAQYVARVSRERRPKPGSSGSSVPNPTRPACATSTRSPSGAH